MTAALALALKLRCGKYPVMSSFIGTLPAVGQKLMAPLLDISDIFKQEVAKFGTGLIGVNKGTVKKGIS